MGWLDGWVLPEEVFPVFEWVFGRLGLEWVAVGVVPGYLMVGMPGDGPAMFVDEPVVEPA